MAHESRTPPNPAAPLIPKAREGRAQRATYVLLALCAAALYLTRESLVHTARILTAHFAALQIGALLKGISYLAEEIFHLETRHGGSFRRALSACLPLHWHVTLLLVCGSAYVALLDEDGQPLGLHLGLACFCQLLILTFGLHKPSAVEISEMSERSKQNVAHGLAWSYYVGYLKIVLPRLKESMEKFSRANPNVLAHRETWKLHILIPLSCDIYDNLEKADNNIQYLMDLPETTLTRAGTKRRVYKHSLYMIKDEDNKDECAAFSREDRMEQAKLFYRTLEEILQGAKECAGTYRLIAYEELGEPEAHLLSREILRHLQQQCQEEYTVCDGTFCSTDLNLQISESDLPQPLRSNCL
ncbi:stimulator of interferon genes protein isoform X2 [Rhea pennata]|uniref:stimulator of interferon genes protein isoform X2 n=1 Tax=Rhea pennata TaxID=8795 RepID=UPI002E26C441